MSEEYSSVADRQKVAQARVHSELTDSARERLAQLTANPMRIRLSTPKGSGGIPDEYIRQTLNLTYEDVGYSGVEEYLVVSSANRQEEVQGVLSGKENPSETIDEFKTHRNLILSGETIPVLAYIENLLRVVSLSRSLHWNEIVQNTKALDVDKAVSATVGRINTALETEGVLWKLDQDDRNFNFHPVGSEMMQQADEEFSVIASGKKWQSVVSPYQSAYDLYRDRTYSREIPEKLYNSIEELARTICVDLERWEDNREQNLSVYLNRMRDEGLFEPNNIMHAELMDLIQSMEKAFQKAGAERKNRHSEIDREYCTLLLHQVSAYLTYLIRQYEEKYAGIDEDSE